MEHRSPQSWPRAICWLRSWGKEEEREGEEGEGLGVAGQAGLLLEVLAPISVSFFLPSTQTQLGYISPSQSPLIFPSSPLTHHPSTSCCTCRVSPIPPAHNRGHSSGVAPGQSWGP